MGAFTTPRQYAASILRQMSRAECRKVLATSTEVSFLNACDVVDFFSQGDSIMAVQGTIAEQIWSWLTDLAVVAFTGHPETRVLVYCYNWATCPSRAMTDREHRACRRLARFCKSRLDIRMGWSETESGRLWV